MCSLSRLTLLPISFSEYLACNSHTYLASYEDAHQQSHPCSETVLHLGIDCSNVTCKSAMIVLCRVQDNRICVYVREEKQPLGWRDYIADSEARNAEQDSLDAERDRRIVALETEMAELQAGCKDDKVLLADMEASQALVLVR